MEYMVLMEESKLALQKTPPKGAVNELPSIFSESWGPSIKLMRGVGNSLEKALDLIPPSEGGHKTRSGILKREQMGDAPWATFLSASPTDEIELRSVELNGGRKKITTTCKKDGKTISISALDNSEEIYITVEEGRFARTVSFTNAPNGTISQLDDVRVRYDKPGSNRMELNYMHRYDATGNRTSINQLKENCILPLVEVGIDPSIYASLFQRSVK